MDKDKNYGEDLVECQICKKKFKYCDVYEYRGFFSCEKHFKELQDKVNYKRREVMEITEHSIKSQRNGEFINNYQKYNINNVAEDGLPFITPKEPQILKDYENGIL
jgi:hypothetical protein